MRFICLLFELKFASRLFEIEIASESTNRCCQNWTKRKVVDTILKRIILYIPILTDVKIIDVNNAHVHAVNRSRGKGCRDYLFSSSFDRVFLAGICIEMSAASHEPITSIQMSSESVFYDYRLLYLCGLSAGTLRAGLMPNVIGL